MLPSSLVSSCCSSSYSPSLAWTFLAASSATQKQKSATEKTLTPCSGRRSQCSRCKFLDQNWHVHCFPVGADPGRLEHCSICWDGTNLSLGCPLLRCPHDLWQLCAVQPAGGHPRRGLLQPGEASQADSSYSCSTGIAFVHDKLPSFNILQFNQMLFTNEEISGCCLCIRLTWYAPFVWGG